MCSTMLQWQATLRYHGAVDAVEFGAPVAEQQVDVVGLQPAGSQFTRQNQVTG